MTLDPTLELWKRTAPRAERAIVNSLTFLDGYPGGGTGGGGTSDRTGTLASRHTALGDRRGDERHRLERLVKELADLVDRLAPNQATTDHLSRQAPDTPGCRSCHRVGRWSEVHARGLCQNCPKLNARVAGRYVWDDDLPPAQLVDMVARGVRVTDREIDRVMHGKKRRE